MDSCLMITIVVKFFEIENPQNSPWKEKSFWGGGGLCLSQIPNLTVSKYFFMPQKTNGAYGSYSGDIQYPQGDYTGGKRSLQKNFGDLKTITRKEKMTGPHHFKKFDFRTEIPLQKSNFLKN